MMKIIVLCLSTTVGPSYFITHFMFSKTKTTREDGANERNLKYRKITEHAF